MRRRRLALILAALGLGLGNAWFVWDLSARVAALEARAPSAAKDGVRVAEDKPDSRLQRWVTSARGGDGEVRGATADAPSSAPLDLSDPAVRDQIGDVIEAKEAEREDQRHQRFVDMLTSNVRTFAADEGLDAKTTEAVIARVLATDDAMLSLRDDMRDGTLDPTAAHTQMASVREAADKELDALLGEERADALREAVFPGGRGGPPHGPPPF
jgi:hypothetical protein